MQVTVILQEGDNIADVIRILNIVHEINHGNLYFWITKEKSRSGREGDNLKLATKEDVVDAVKRAADAVDAFTREWERLEQDLSLKREQESALQKAIEDDKIKESSKISEAQQPRDTLESFPPSP
ncbi:uncharacterized protein LOC111334708 [Stylophora pistillata]|uniref:uncharacterized protein LOC111334708 n=1 Tax=Stylophora pistillata TaxID=50429 RepID=UPI000C04994F|nr:uncharacterized protein LOC111334708 [Stylophora pistillata]